MFDLMSNTASSVLNLPAALLLDIKKQEDKKKKEFLEHEFKAKCYLHTEKMQQKSSRL